MKSRMIKRLSLIALTLSIYLPGVIGGEGMWLPLLLDSLNIEEMKQKGFKLDAEDIYSVNQGSLKDAVVIFGNGCTGELISAEGLLITNHHCGFSRILGHSTLEHNYLAEGFWAKSKEEELANPGLTVTFLVRMEDVTRKVLSGADTLPEEQRLNKISANAAQVRSEAIKGTHYQAEVKSFFFGLEYYLFVYEIYTDVRLVGAPPEAIGNFGGDTDNWIWPRHTGDFSLFRIYAGKDNLPAAYSKDNVPYKPKKHFSISTDGVQEGDFTMVLGYPGRTDQFLTADGLDLIARKSLPAKVEMRTEKLHILKDIMNRGPEYKLRYASKHVNISNAWKKWMGAVKGIEKAGAIEQKKVREQQFTQWASSNASDKQYEGLMGEFSNIYSNYAPIYLANDLGGEMLNAIELSNLVNTVQIKFYEAQDSSAGYQKENIAELKKAGRGFYKSNGLEIDRKTLPALLKIYNNYNEPQFHPAFYNTITRKFGNDYDAYVADVFANSMFTDSLRFMQTLGKSEKVIRERLMVDPLIQIYRDFSMMLSLDGTVRLDSLDLRLKQLYKDYVSGLKAMNPSMKMYPDANFTMRISYGNIMGYSPLDAIQYDYQTTLQGVFEKENPEIRDYTVPARLKTIYNSKDTSRFSMAGKVPVCFIASNHTSGGNSGSPVLNAYGDLIGVNFDRNWEGTMSDFAYDPQVCRNISLDIRYVLYLIDNYAEADWLLDELTLVKR
jgi:hypothetical protein